MRGAPWIDGGLRERPRVDVGGPRAVGGDARQRAVFRAFHERRSSAAAGPRPSASPTSMICGPWPLAAPAPPCARRRRRPRRRRVHVRGGCGGLAAGAGRRGDGLDRLERNDGDFGRSRRRGRAPVKRRRRQRQRRRRPRARPERRAGAAAPAAARRTRALAQGFVQFVPQSPGSAARESLRGIVHAGGPVGKRNLRGWRT